MTKYTIRFYGRELGAIGMFYWIIDYSTAETLEDAILKLYDKYDSVMQPKVIKSESV